MNTKGVSTRVSKHQAASPQSTLQEYPRGNRFLDASVESAALITRQNINVKPWWFGAEHPEFAFAYRDGRIETTNITAWQRAGTEIGISDLNIHDLRLPFEYGYVRLKFGKWQMPTSSGMFAL